MPLRQPHHPDAPTYVDFPFRIDWDGRTATTDEHLHVRNMLEQLLFTSPGERVNRPSFGSGLEQAVFRPNNALFAETTRVTAEAAIQQWLGHVLQLDSLRIAAEDNILNVEISYTLLHTKESQTIRLQRSH